MKLRKFFMLAAGLTLSIIMCFALFACKKNNNSDGTESGSDTDAPPSMSSLTVFDGASYTAKFVYDGDSLTVGAVNEKLSSALKSRFGSAPELVKDNALAADASAVEVLIGATDRAESSSCVEVGENDAWYYVGAVGNKIVINGSNEYMLKLAADAFIEKYL